MPFIDKVDLVSTPARIGTAIAWERWGRGSHSKFPTWTR